MELSSSTSAKRKPKDASTRGRGGGNRGGRTPNNNDRQTGPPKQSKDADGINNYDQSSDGKLTLDHKGKPLCNYCGISNHSRTACRARLRDVDNGVIRQTHPNKGKFGLGNRGRQDLQQKITNAADQWGDPWATQQTPQRSQGMQWNQILQFKNQILKCLFQYVHQWRRKTKNRRYQRQVQFLIWKFLVQCKGQEKPPVFLRGGP